MTYCANVDAGQILRSNSLNMANIRLIRPKNLARPHVRSLRPPFSDSLLGTQIEAEGDIIVLQPQFPIRYARHVL